MKVHEPVLPERILSKKVKESLLETRDFQQLFLDSMILHFVVDLDNPQDVQFSDKSSLENLIVVGNDNYVADKLRLLVVDNFSQFMTIKLT